MRCLPTSGQDQEGEVLCELDGKIVLELSKIMERVIHCVTCIYRMERLVP